MAIAQAAPMAERAAVDRRFALLWRTQEGAVSKCHVQIEAAPLSQIVEKEMKIIQK